MLCAWRAHLWSAYMCSIGVDRSHTVFRLISCTRASRFEAAAAGLCHSARTAHCVTLLVWKLIFSCPQCGGGCRARATRSGRRLRRAWSSRSGRRGAAATPRRRGTGSRTTTRAGRTSGTPCCWKPTWSRCVLCAASALKAAHNDVLAGSVVTAPCSAMLLPAGLRTNAGLVANGQPQLSTAQPHTQPHARVSDEGLQRCTDLCSPNRQPSARVPSARSEPSLASLNAQQRPDATPDQSPRPYFSN